jgi:hypothetical protein
MTSIIYYPGYSQVKIQENLQVKTILSITNSNPMLVMTASNHGYVVGMMVKFLIPEQFKMVELNNIDCQVISLTDDTLTLNLDSTNFSIFSYPSPLPSAYTNPSVIPNSSGPYLPPLPLPFGNQDSFEGVIFNNGTPGNPISIT